MNGLTPWQQRLQSTAARESQTLLLFLTDAYPWARYEDRAVLDQLRRMIAEEQQALAALTNFLSRRRIPLPQFGFFPTQFTSLLFVSLDFLLPQLVEQQRQAVAQLEADLAEVPDPAARQFIERIMAVKGRHLKKLAEMTATLGKPAHA